MGDNQRLMVEMLAGRHSVIHGSITEEDLHQIWNIICNRIDASLKTGRGIQIPGLGSFSVTLPSSSSRPVFVASRAFVAAHLLRVAPSFQDGRVHVQDLNFSQLAHGSAFSREVIEAFLDHFRRTLSRVLNTEGRVDVAFAGIGILRIFESRLKFVFFKNFVREMSGGDNRMLEKMKNRPDTMDSVTSLLGTKALLNTDDDAMGEVHSFQGAVHGQVISGHTIPLPQSQDAELSRPRTSSMKGILVRRPMSASGLSRPSSANRIRNIVSNSKTLISDEKLGDFPKPQSRSSLKLAWNGPKSRTPGEEKEMSQVAMEDDVDAEKEEKREAVERDSTPQCHHMEWGQELCYICHQRASKNIPLYMDEMKSRKEREADRIFQQMQHKKDLVISEAERLLLEKQRVITRSVSAYNLKKAEDRMSQRDLEHSDAFFDHPKAYIFKRRPATPDKIIAQERYCEDLDRQVSSKYERTRTEKVQTETYELRQRRARSADLANERLHYLQKKSQDQADYNEALRMQMKYRKVEPPARLPDDTEIFGKTDGDKEKEKERKNRNLEFAAHQQQTAEKQKMEESLRRLDAQREQAENITKIKNDLLRDRGVRHRRAKGNREKLEDAWMEAKAGKDQKDAEERHHMMGVEGGLVHEQCDQYRKCYQCQRHLYNAGESNIWKDSRYPAGTRFMV